MKKTAIIILSIVAFIAVLVGVVFMMTSGITDTAEDFFTEIKAENYTKAYTYLSEDFKANTSEDDFIKFLGNSALLNFKETSWSSRSMSGGKGELDGSVITETGGVIPIKVGFIKENDDWKIYSLYKPEAGLVQNNSSGKLPETDELMKITDESLLKFAHSVNSKDFSEFHSYISNLWRKQITVDELNEIFKPFTDAEINLVTALNTYNPQFDVNPAINEDGVMILEGHYPTQPSVIIFKLSYIYEGIGWKLIGTDINVQ